MSQMDPTPELPVLPYGAISPEFENLLTATINKVDLEWPAKWQAYPGAKYIVESCARITLNTHLSIRYLCAQEPPQPERKVEFALSAIPIIRSLADTIFLPVFLFEDVPQRTALYLKGGWREWAEELARCRAAYGNVPVWRDWLEEFEKRLQGSRDLAGISDAEAANPTAIPYWPTPAQMLRPGQLTAESRALFTHLNDWFYRTFSSQTHLSLPGLIMRSAGLYPATDDETTRVRDWRLDRQRSDAMSFDLLLCLATVSEIQAACSFGLEMRLRYIWGILSGFFGMAKELYELRYDKLLP